MKHHPVYNKYPVLALKEFTLRELSIYDAENFYSYISDPNVNKFLSSEDFPLTLEAAKEEMLYWSKLFYYKHSIYWGIAENSYNNLIGTCGFNNWSIIHKRAEVSYDLNSKYWGKGIMTKALGRVCRFAFEELKVNRIQATVAIDNPASIRVLEKLGFKREGMLKEYGVLHGINTDFYMYGLVKGN